MATALPKGLFAILLAVGVTGAAAQNLPAPEDSRHSMLREAMLGLLPVEASIPEARAQRQCIELPAAPPSDRLLGPHGDSLLSANCEVTAYEILDGARPAQWAAARYRWISLFTAEDAARGPTARDTVVEEEVVLFDAARPGRVRPVWHARFETGRFAIWRSVTPEIAATDRGTTLLSVMSCLNGTGGCGQEFLQRHKDRRWSGVRQDWFDQLPDGFGDRIRHGVRIDPRTLHGEAGFYGDRDANCCPSQLLVVDLAVRGASLVLLRQSVVPQPER